LVDSKSLQANFPVLDLSGFSTAEATQLMKRVYKKIREKKQQSSLPYMGVWLKRSDTLHQLMMFDDHFISDGTSSLIIQQRLEHIIKGNPLTVSHCYRDYIQNIWQKNDTEISKAVTHYLDLQNTAVLVEPTIHLLKQ